MAIKIKLLFFTFFLFFISSCKSFAQDYDFNSGRVDWPENKSAPGTMENEMDELFGGLAIGCGIEPYKQKNKIKISYLPADIRKNAKILRFPDSVVSVKGESAKRMMSFIFKGEDIKQISTNRRIDFINYIVGGRGDLALAPVARIASDALGYHHTCTSLLRTTLASNLKIPVASMTAALDAENKTTSNMVLLKGVFENPLYERIVKLDPEILLQFWYAYVVGGGYTSDMKILKGFSGIAVMQVQTTDRKTEFKIDSSTGAATPIFGAEMAVTAGLAANTALSSSQYSNYIYAPEGVPEISFANVPPPDVIQKSVAAIIPVLQSKSLIFEGADFSILSDLPGIPDAVCNESIINIEFHTGEELNGANYSARTESSSGRGICRVSVIGRLPLTAVKNDTHKIRFNITMGDGLPGAKTLKLAIPVVKEVRISRHPIVRRQATVVEGKKYGSGDMEWTYPLDIWDGERSVDRTRMDEVRLVGSPTLKCPSGSSPLTGSFAVTEGRILISLKSKPFAGAPAAGTQCELENFQVKIPAVGAGDLTMQSASATLELP